MTDSNILPIQNEIAFVPQNQNSSPYINYLMSPSGLGLLGCLIIFGLLSLLGNNSKKGKLATSYWGGSIEKKAAKIIALEQIANPQRNAVALSIGLPDTLLLKLQEQWVLKGYSQQEIKRRKPNPHPLFIPDVQRGCLVLGAAGTGKSFSVIDPMIRSALDQGFPCLLYDFKFPTQSSRAIAYALKRGYKIRFFTPNFPFSDVCNLLEFLEDEEDAVAAGQLAEVITKNINLDPNASGDKFFDDAGAALVQGIFLLTKAIAKVKGKNYADLMTASALLSLPNLGKRLEYSRQLNQFSIWAMRPLAQLISVANSPETEASIIGTAQKTFEKFLKKSFIGAFSGDTTLPLDLDGKTLLVCGLDRNNRDIVGPLMAAVIHMIVSRNVSRQIPRKDPLCVFLDELPTLYLPQLYEWLTQNREDGFCGIIGCQNFSQLEKTYGKEVAKIIFGNCATKFLFNPQEVESAEYFAKILGEFDVEYQSKSRSHNFGKGSSGSKSDSDQRQKRHLWETSQFMKLGTGKMILLNPAYQRGEEQYVPIKQRIRIHKSEIEEMQWSQAKFSQLWEYLAQQRQVQVDDDTRRSQFEERQKLVDELFPLPQLGENSAQIGQKPDESLASLNI